MTTVVTMVARCRIDSLNVLTKDSAFTVRGCANIVLAYLGSVCSAVAMGFGRPISSIVTLHTLMRCKLKSAGV